MPQLMEYLIRLSATLAVMYLFYWLVLSRHTFYTSNRWYLLLYSMLAFFIPLINIAPVLEEVQITSSEVVQWVPVIRTEKLYSDTDANHIATVEKWTLALVLVSVGTMIMLIRFFFQCWSVCRMRRNAELISDGEVKVYQVNKNIIPFSFGRSIFINQYKHKEDELKDIIRHEFIHVRQNHTIDVLWSEWLCIMNWYNPFAWLIRNAIRQNLEFIADDKVVQNGIDKKQYQYLLLKVIGTPQYCIANNFNFNSLKKRIAMMNKMRSARVHLVKFLFVQPLAAFMLLAFRNEIKERTRNGIQSAATQSNNTFAGITDTVPSPKPASRPHVFPVPAPNSKGYVITVADNAGECVVIVKNKQNKIVKAVSLVDWDQNAKEFTAEYGEIPPPPPPAPPAAAPVKVPAPPAAPAAPALPADVSSVHVKDKKWSITLKNCDTETYDLDVPQQEASFEKKYGPRLSATPNPANAGNDILIVDRKDNKNNNQNDVLILDKKENQNANQNTDHRKTETSDIQEKDADTTPANGGKVTITTLGNFPGLIIVDGKHYDHKSFDLAVNLDVSDIASVEVFKGQKAKELYGEKGKEGAIKITTKSK